MNEQIVHYYNTQISPTSNDSHLIFKLFWNFKQLYISLNISFISAELNPTKSNKIIFKYQLRTEESLQQFNK